MLVNELIAKVIKTCNCYRIINPIVVAPTVAAVGLAFFSYGFPQAGTCMEISIPQIALVLLFTLVSISGSNDIE